MTLSLFRRVAMTASALSLALAPLVARAEPAGVHVVEPGETLSQIADNAGVDSVALAKLNNLDDMNFLVAGQTLKLPATSAARSASASASSAASAPAPSAASASASSAVPSASASASSAASAAAAPSASAASSAALSPRTYVVADGDTLWSIAQQFSTTTAALVDANNLTDPDHVVVGAQLVVPGSAPSAPATTPAPATIAAARPSAPAPPARRSLLVSYTVQAGETLSQIARQFEVRAEAIAQASALDDPNRLSIGAVLKVPLPGHEHEVKAGETLRDIAAQEKVDLGSLIDFNALDDPELIRIGQVLLVPTPPNLQAATANAPAAGAAASSTTKAAVRAASAPASDGPAPAPAAASAPAVAPAAKPAAPAAVIAAPRRAPSDGLVGAGLKLLGAPYVWGGSSPNGFDCSGFVWYAARQAGKSLSRGMLGEYNSGAHPARDELKPGDLVFFQNTYSAGLSHNGIYIGNNQFIHAVDEAAGVAVSSLGTAYWSSHWFGATRLP